MSSGGAVNYLANWPAQGTGAAAVPYIIYGMVKAYQNGILLTHTTWLPPPSAWPTMLTTARPSARTSWQQQAMGKCLLIDEKFA